MKKIIILLLSLPILFIVASCNSGTSGTTTTTTTTTSTVEKYEAVGIEVGYRQGEIAYYNEEYTPTNLYVQLIYSNNIKTDITYACTYTVDTSQLGEVRGYATYMNFSAPIVLNVVIPSIIGIQLSNESNYKNFKIGDIYNPDNVTILALYNNGYSGRITSFDYAIFYSDDTVLINGSPFDKSGEYQVVFTLLIGSNRFEALYFISVEYEPDENTVVFEMEDNLFDTTENFSFNEFTYSDLFESDYVDIEAIGENNGIRNKIGEYDVYGSYQGKEYRSCIYIPTPSTTSTPDSLKFIVKTDVIIKMVVYTTVLPYLSKDEMRTNDISFEGEVGFEVSEISVSLTEGTYYLGHGLTNLSIFEIAVVAV